MTKRINEGGMVRASGSPEQQCWSRSWETQEGFRKGWGLGACGVKRSGGSGGRGEGGTAGGIAGWNAVGTGELKSKIKRGLES